ncbi:MAG TPA: sugar phosphate isomerase/epimerase [Isosphaeraceae bacterium]|nr:sugar phosphate isomerase/epimerase [Isosphaeraceae bacterium]
MFVACSTLCFSKEPLESALRHLAELEFNKIDLAIVENSPHLRPSEVAENPEAALHRIRYGPSLTPSALDLDFGTDLDLKTLRKRFEAMCRLAKPLTVAVLTIQAAPLGTPFDDEVLRLRELSEVATREGLVLAAETHSQTLTADPATAVALCKAVPGLGLTLDPSHYIHGPHQGGSFDEVYPFVQNVHLRDTGRQPGDFQVRVGQGEVEYGRIVSQLERYGYDRALTVSIFDSLESPFDNEVEVRKLKLLLESLI